MKRQRVRYYHSFTEDFTESAQQDFALPEDYQWVPTGRRYRFLSGLTYGAALIFGWIYCKCVLHLRIHGREKLKGVSGGFFLYGNHTQSVGDVVIPAFCAWPRRIYTVVSPANYGIPVIGKVLPYLGALPTVHSIKGIKELSHAMETRLAQGRPIVIYPEAHVWDYCTEIRPFPDSSFKFPAKWDLPIFTMTTTYHRSRFFRRPVTHVYLDGPFYPQGDSVRARTAYLHAQAQETMTRRSRSSDYAYILYHPADPATKTPQS